MILLPTLDQSLLFGVVPTVPGLVTLIVNITCFINITKSNPHSASHPNTLVLVLFLMLPRFGVTFLILYTVPYIILPPSGKSSNLTCLQKPIFHSLPVIPLSLYFRMKIHSSRRHTAMRGVKLQSRWRR